MEGKRIEYQKDAKGGNLREHDKATIWKGSNRSFFKAVYGNIVPAGLYRVQSKTNTELHNIIKVNGVTPSNTKGTLDGLVVKGSDGKSYRLTAV